MSEIVSSEGSTKKARAKAKAEPPRPGTKKPGAWTEAFATKLTRDEIAAKGDEAAKLDAEIEALEADKKSAVTSFKGRVDSKKSELRDVMRAIRTGEEMRPVEVYEEYEYRTNTCFVRRRDTREVVRQRALTVDERQEDLFAGAKKPGPQATLGEAVAAKAARNGTVNGKPRGAAHAKAADGGDTEITQPSAILEGAKPDDEPKGNARPARRRGR